MESTKITSSLHFWIPPKWIVHDNSITPAVKHTNCTHVFSPRLTLPCSGKLLWLRSHRREFRALPASGRSSVTHGWQFRGKLKKPAKSHWHWKSSRNRADHVAIHDNDENIDSSKGEFTMQKCLFWSLPYYIHMYIVCMVYLYNGNVALSNHGKPIWLGGWSFCSRLTKYRVHVFETSLSFECKILIFNGSPKCSGKKNSVTKLRCIPFKIPHSPLSPTTTRFFFEVACKASSSSVIRLTWCLKQKPHGFFKGEAYEKTSLEFWEWPSSTIEVTRKVSKVT